jgi:hypothetical protein
VTILTEASTLLSPLVVIPAQIGSSPWLEGGIFVVLAGAVLFAVCRSSRRN